MPFTISAERESYQSISNLRKLFLHTLNAQFRYEVCHIRRWADYCSLKLDGEVVGYAAVKGMESLTNRATIFEFYLLPGYRQHAWFFFRRLLDFTDARYIEFQSNDDMLAALAPGCCSTVHHDLWLLEDDHVTQHLWPGAEFRKRKSEETIAWQLEEPGDYLLLLGDKIVAEGGFLLHYNLPYADIHMSVTPAYQGRGIGSYFVQELKKACYLSGRIPAARCQFDNLASRETLQKAGMRICGQLLWGEVNSTAAH